MYMYLRQVCGRGHRTPEPFGSTFNALSLSYPQAQFCYLFYLIDASKLKHNQQTGKTKIQITLI